MSAPTRGETTRQKLLDAAARHFAAAGYHGTSFNDLIAESGVSKGACYHHFRSKEDLALATYRATQERLIRGLASAAEGLSSPAEQLFTWLRVRARAFAKDPTLQCLPRLSSDLAKDPALAHHVKAMHSAAIHAISAQARRAQEAGELRRDLDAALVGRVLFAALVGIGEMSDRESGGADHPQRTEELITLLATTMVPASPGRKHGAGKRPHVPSRNDRLRPRAGRRGPAR